MGGEVLDLPEIVIYRQGKAEGEKERKELQDEVAALRKELEELKKQLSKE